MAVVNPDDPGVSWALKAGAPHDGAYGWYVLVFRDKRVEHVAVVYFDDSGDGVYHVYRPTKKKHFEGYGAWMHGEYLALKPKSILAHIPIDYEYLPVEESHVSE